jgi:tRNA(fMet)-specific endonuclease VapC
MYVLDTNVCIELLNARDPALIDRFRRHRPADLVLCSIVRAELLWGARRSRRVEANLERVKAFAAPLRTLPFDDLCAEHYGIIRADLAAQGTPIGHNDTLIAAIARAHDAVLVTHNVKEFGRITGLRLQDWHDSA